MPSINRIEQAVCCGHVKFKRLYDYTMSLHKQSGATSQEMKDFSRYLIIKFRKIYRNLQK